MKHFSIIVYFLFFISLQVFGQIVDPFAIRYQTNLKGGLVFLANTSIGCNCAANNETPPGGSSDNNDFSMTYSNTDSDPGTFMSNSDQLDLPNCSEIVWAGLYWVGMLNTNASTTPNYSVRNKVKLSANGGSYIDLTADEILDNTVGKTMYNCFKDVTSIVQANPINATYRIANVVTLNGSNTFGGWTMVVIYRNIYESMKNLTVFDGLANVSTASGTVNINLNGFLTPPSGPVNFELGVVAHDGDRGQTGDQLAFNGAGSFVNISDALHTTNNAFNSTISRNGVLTPLRNPSFNNNLGHDANIYSPNNSTFNFIGNSASSAQIRVSTTSETVLTSVITSAIDIYEPDLRANVAYTDLNGGAVQPGDILEYSITAKNIGSDVSVNTYLKDTLDARLQYLPGTLTYAFGPNSGIKTDATDSDQAEFIAASNVISARIGTGANGTTGGAVVNSSTGADSTVITFRVKLHEDCAVWQCGTILQNQAYLFGTGQISGISNGNNGLSDELDASGCPSPESGIVYVNTTACTPFLLTYTDSVCTGETIQFNFPNSPNITYTWTGPNGFSSTIYNPSIPNSALTDAGDYFLTVVYNGTTCVDDTIAPVFVSDPPTLQFIDLQNDTCYQAGGGSIQVVGQGNGPFTYDWSNNDPNALADSLYAGTYSVVITDQYHCNVSDTFTITEPAEFIVAASVTSDYNGQDISCFGASDGSASASTTGGIVPISLLWPGNGTTGNSISNLSAGQYTVQATDQTGCIAIDSVTITEPDSIQITAITTDILCFGDSTGAINTSITGGTQAYTFSWENGEATEDLSTLPVGTYALTVTDANACVQVDSFTVTQPALPITISAINTPIACFGDSASLLDLSVIGGVGPYTYLWGGGETTQDLTSVFAGTYSVTVTDANGCLMTFDHTVTEPGEITATFANTNPVCEAGSQGAIDLVLSGGTPGFTYFWNSTDTTEDLTGLFAGTYVCSVSDQNGCTASFQTTLTDPDALALTSVISDVLCYGDSTGQIDITVSNGALPYTFDWTNGDIAEDADSLSIGIYAVNVADANGCGFFESFVIDQPDTSLYFTSASSTAILCFGDTTATISITEAGGTLPYSYSWSNGDTTQNVSDLSAGTYVVTVSDINGCQISQSFDITEPPLLELSETHTDILCFGDATGAVDASTTGGTVPYNYAWSNSGTNEDLTAITAGTYTLTTTDGNGCTASLSVTISQPTMGLALSSTPSDVFCFGGSDGAIDLTITGGTPSYSLLWNTSETTEDLSAIEAGTYTVTITDANGCTLLQSITVDQPAAPLTLTGNGSSICLGASNGEVIVEANGGTPVYSYQWSSSPDDTLDVVTNLPPGTYEVVVTDQNGCTESINFTVDQPDELEGCVVLEMPNVFSPNGDNTNDLCTPVKVLNIKSYKIEIINRWGLLMYQGDDYSTGWDGNAHGDPASEGVYFYKVVYTDNYDQDGVRQGFVTLIRQ
jgi:gliding motility-associated-like protein/uncharacterized repeat protein (TIGR01451 family)